MELNLANKNVLVVGASKGIGRAICEAFAAEKSKIVGVARTKSLLEDVKSDCLKIGASSFEYIVADVMDQDNFDFAKFLFEQYGHFDVIVHCVGGSLTSRDICGGYKDYEEYEQIVNKYFFSK